MPGKLSGILLAVLLSSVIGTGSAAAQVEWPVLPDNWWTNLEDGGYPSATVEVVGMGMTITQSIESVEGSQITLSTAVSMMGNAMPPQQQVIEASTLTAEGGVALMQGMGGPQASQAPSDLDIDIRRIEDTTCRVGTLELACTEYEVIAEGMTSRVWHAPQIPPVFVGGVVRAEATISGQSFVSSMTSYTGRLID